MILFIYKLSKHTHKLRNIILLSILKNKCTNDTTMKAKTAKFMREQTESPTNKLNFNKWPT